MPVGPCAHAEPDEDFAFLVRWDGDMPFLCRADHRLGERVARMNLRTRGISKHLFRLPVLVEGKDIGHDGSTDRQGAGLVEDDCVDAAGLFKV